MRTPWPFRHFGLKLLSVLLAVLLWMMVAGEETVERGLRIPLELQQFPAGIELVGEPPSLVDVRVRGGSGTLSRLTPVDVVAVLDLRGAHAGRRLFHLTPEQVRAPFGVEIVQVSPPTILLDLENTAVKTVPIVPPIDGDPAPGFVVGEITTDPKTVEIVGPDSSVKRATAATTEPVSVAGARAPVRDTVTVGLLDPSLRLKTSRSAAVDVQIEPAPLERTLRNLPVHLRHLSPTLTAQSIPATIDVTVRGSRVALNRIGSDAISAYVDLSGLGAGQYTLQVRADATREAGIARVEPPTVRVKIGSVKD
jgi:YbbR domain-containing protein